MLTNCPIDELLSAVEKAYSKFDETKYDLKSPPTKDIIYLLKCILENLMGVKIVSYIDELFDFLFIAMKYHETIISISTGIIYCVLELEYVIYFLQNVKH
jgi:hypothetical protein